MTREIGFKTRATRTAAAGALCFVMAASAVAGDRSPRIGRALHGTWTQTTQVQRTADGHTRHDVWRNAQGQTATRDVVVTNDRSAHTQHRNAVWTGPEGKSTTVDSVTRRTQDGWHRDVTQTRPDGTTRGRDVDVSCDKSTHTCTKVVKPQ